MEGQRNEKEFTNTTFSIVSLARFSSRLFLGLSLVSLLAFSSAANAAKPSKPKAKTETKSKKSSKSKTSKVSKSSKSSKESKESKKSKKSKHNEHHSASYEGGVKPRKEINDWSVVQVGFNTNATAQVNSLRRSIVASAEQFIGLPYILGARSPQQGFDCSGLVGYVLEQHGIALDPTARQQQYIGEQIPLEFVRPGDLVFFAEGNESQVGHVAIVASFDESGLTVIHATTSRGIVRENISKSNYWMKKLRYASNILGASDVSHL
ncbi:MAG: hypothetical protein RL757_388 [Bacteroidota bacterium]|jgi:cell wall-associated NlpC family hydrolase